MAEPLVLLPGMMCDARLFAPQVAALSPEREVRVLPITEGGTIEDIARGVLAAAPETFALAGLSMGGIVAMEILRRAPDRVSRIALLDTNCLSERPEFAAAREPQIVRVRAGKLREVMRDEMKPRYLAPGPKRFDVLTCVMEMAEDLGPDVFERQSRALQRRRDYQDTLKEVQVPALVLCGRHDALCPVRRHEFMAALIPGAELVVIEEAGHLPTLETPAETTGALRAWLAR